MGLPVGLRALVGLRAFGSSSLVLARKVDAGEAKVVELPRVVGLAALLRAGDRPLAQDRFPFAMAMYAPRRP